ncbi:TPA: amidohydrolase [Raoultella ornithinolytica]|uniref:amidohydrolase n=1 Tax=Raoultella TaxID=160674 RepID=UPI0004D41710|nr:MULTISPECIES: amidohydrolase [Raoultella]KDV92399.1 amidohydrolase family protein [Raoultella ornithinolytica 2-156-04_S1_C1]KDX13626.1 amidohydrolase family protein [Raoultella ornithinolytica 2-156-04_S1_C2]MDX7500137.1 amidohydrolase [Raoultella ornithinolytica]OWP44656.1 amidohydrolase [Raoultella ornithinolytica]QQN44763.1 amidohydrolase [Raoultella sp. XY-1]
MINPVITAIIAREEQATIDFRRDLHAHPELPWEERRTTDRVVAELENIGIACRRTAPTGVIADITGSKPGKTVALRADMDALPVHELNDRLSYKSLTAGKMHACGHDSHTAMLLTAARALYEVREQMAGNVRLIFQPAEEIAEGAKAMIAQGALDNVDNIFGMHIWSGSPSGKISCNVGSSFASADLLKVTFRGRGGHGSMPEACIDAAVVASAFVMNLQAIVARETSPLDSAVVSIGRMDVGTRFNVIAENALLDGTVRCFSIETRRRLEAAITRYAQHTAAMYGASVDVDYCYGTLPVINEERSALLAQSTIREAFGDDVLFSEKPTTGGEDFSFYLQDIPGCFALLGSGNKAKGSDYAHHHGCFNIDEQVMKTGAGLYAQYAWRYLHQDRF